MKLIARDGFVAGVFGVGVGVAEAVKLIQGVGCGEAAEVLTGDFALADDLRLGAFEFFGGETFRAQEFGFPDEEAAFALQYGHGVGLSIWEKPIFSRLVSLDHPEMLSEGMVFALETYWPARDGWSAARIEEEVVVTADGCEVITKFPAEELLVAGRRYWTAGGELSTLRESQSHLNSPAFTAARPALPTGSR